MSIRYIYTHTYTTTDTYTYTTTDTYIYTYTYTTFVVGRGAADSTLASQSDGPGSIPKFFLCFVDICTRIR